MFTDLPLVDGDMYSLFEVLLWYVLRYLLRLILENHEPLQNLATFPSTDLLIRMQEAGNRSFGIVSASLINSCVFNICSSEVRCYFRRWDIQATGIIGWWIVWGVSLVLVAELIYLGHGRLRFSPTLLGFHSARSPSYYWLEDTSPLFTDSRFNCPMRFTCF